VDGHHVEVQVLRAGVVPGEDDPGLAGRQDGGEDDVLDGGAAGRLAVHLQLGHLADIPGYLQLHAVDSVVR